jgi:DNA-binding transcriptional MocR family regulator
VSTVADGTRLDPYVQRYAARTAGMTASEIRALFAVASRPEVVSLAGGMPYTAALPWDAIADTVADLLRTHGATALQYGSGQGDQRLREQIGEIVDLVGVNTHPDDVIVTVGSQQALDLVTRVFCDPGDAVIVESPSYVGALGTFAAYECDVRHVAMDEQGLVPEAVAAEVQRLAREGRKAKFVYTIPSFQNPAGVTQSAQRRAELLAVAAEHDLLVLEDDPYALLGFDGVVPRAMRADDDERVVYLGSFSKIFAPGVRVGYAVAPHGLREKLVLAAEASILCPPAYSQWTVSAYLDTQPWQEQIKTFREVYRERRDALLDGLQSLMPPGTTWTVPAGGFYSWVTLPEGMDATAMLPRAVTARVAYVPGTGFYAGAAREEGRRSMRLSYCFPTADRITEGVRRLAGVVEAEQELLDTFGPAAVHHPQPSLGDTPSPDLA